MEVSEICNGADRTRRNFYAQDRLAIGKKSMDVDGFAVRTPDWVSSACRGQALPMMERDILEHHALLI
jgi:hypothetical protein